MRADDSGHIYDLPGLARSLAAVLDEMSDEAIAAAVELSFPPRPELGDVATNAALVSAKRLRRAPRDIAAELGERWSSGDGAAVCDRVEVAGPGFLNLHLGDAWYRGAVDVILRDGDDYGRGVLPAAERRTVNVEFVSANPVGPLHIGNARYGAMGDALCRLFDFAGHDVTAEYYVNDAGTQMILFGQTLAARYARALGIEAEIPENGYQGDYVAGLAAELVAEAGDRYRDVVAAAAPDMTRLPDDVVTELKLWGRDRMVAGFRATLTRLRVHHDVWTNESSVYEGEGEHRGFRGEVAKSLADLDGEDLLYEHEGAVWLKTTAYGDDKDRVLIRQTGESTYFLSDIAYHRDKMDRGFEHMIDIWGADHHGYVPRMKAAFTALPPHDPDRLELIIGQFVNLMEGGEAKRMSKRRGDIVTVDDLMDAIGVDAVRFFMVSRGHDSTLDLDLELAAEQSSKNPVYYVQYAHARICSILRRIEEEGRPVSGLTAQRFASAGLDVHERALVRALVRFPIVVREAVDGRAPHRVAAYLGELSAEFHGFYRNCRVLVDDDATSSLRTALCLATRSILAAGLGLLGVEAPERM
jgi:arginyl-tRNA synthetase